MRKQLSLFDQNNFIQWGQNTKRFSYNRKIGYCVSGIGLSWKDFIYYMITYCNTYSIDISDIVTIKDEQQKYDYLLKKIHQHSVNEYRNALANGYMKCDSYNVGDKVIVISKEMFDQACAEQNNTTGEEVQFGNNIMCNEMINWLGKMVTISSINYGGQYRIEECDYYWTNEMFVGKVTKK